MYSFQHVLSVACSTEKAGESLVYLFHVSMTQSENGEHFKNEQAAFRVLLNRLHTQCSVYTTIALHSDACGNLPDTLALFPVLGPVRPCTIKPFLPSFLS